MKKNLLLALFALQIFGTHSIFQKAISADTFYNKSYCDDITEKIINELYANNNIQLGSRLILENNSKCKSHAKFLTTSAGVSFRLRDFKNGMKKINYVIKLHPNNATAIYTRATMRSKLNDQYGALDDLNKVMNLPFQDKSSIYSFRAIVKNRLEDFEGAYEDSNKSLEIKPHSQGYVARGWSKMYMYNDYKGAIKDLTRGIELWSKNGEAYRLRGMANARLGKTKDACNDFFAAKEIDPPGSPMIDSFAAIVGVNCNQ